MQFTSSLFAMALAATAFAASPCAAAPAAASGNQCGNDQQMACCDSTGSNGDLLSLDALHCVLGSVLGNQCNSQPICCTNTGSGVRSLLPLD